MSTYVPVALRRSVVRRAQGICEYCLIACADTFLPCSVEHIIAEKHRGKTVAANLAIACMLCNRFKGSDISSLSRSGKLCRLFNPRVDQWRNHFILDGNLIRPLTDIGHAVKAH
jgi:HNH endonuclease